MRIVEYRIRMPCTLAQYEIGQLYACARLSEEQTLAQIEGGVREGVEVVANEPYDAAADDHGGCPDVPQGAPPSGQYTDKDFRFRR